MLYTFFKVEHTSKTLNVGMKTLIPPTPPFYHGVMDAGAQNTVELQGEGTVFPSIGPVLQMVSV